MPPAPKLEAKAGKPERAQDKQEAKREEAKQQEAKLERVKPGPKRLVANNASHRPNKTHLRSADSRSAHEQRAHNVVVTQTYQLADGRRVTVTRTYLRGAQTAEARGAPVTLYEPEGTFDRNQQVRYRTSAREAFFEE